MSRIRTDGALDLFAIPPAPVVARPPAPPPAPRPRLETPDAPPAWRALLARAGDPEALVLVDLSGEHYTGAVVAVLALPAIGVHHLHSDDLVLDYSVHPSRLLGHILLRTADAARELHRRIPLVSERWISMSTHLYRAARPGEPATPELLVPPYHQH